MLYIYSGIHTTPYILVSIHNTSNVLQRPRFWYSSTVTAVRGANVHVLCFGGFLAEEGFLLVTFIFVWARCAGRRPFDCRISRWNWFVQSCDRDNSELLLSINRIQFFANTTLAFFFVFLFFFVFGSWTRYQVGIRPRVAQMQLQKIFLVFRDWRQLYFILETSVLKKGSIW